MPRVKPVLLVEDNEDDALMLQRAFQKAGISILISRVRDGMAAIEYLSGSGPFRDRAEYPVPRLVLLDLKLPKRSGFEVLAWLRSQPEFEALPVTILTSSSEEEDVVRAYRLGANSYLQKPNGSADLVFMAERIHDYWYRLNLSPL